MEHSRMGMKLNGGRFVLGCLAGALLALASPLITLTQLFSSMPMLLLPAVGLTAIHRWAGRAAAYISGTLMLLSFGSFTGNIFMWAMFLLMLNPLMLLLRIGDRPFFSQLRTAIFGFGAGLMMTVVMLSLAYGGGLITRLTGIIPELIQAMEPEAIEAALATMPGITADASAFTARVDAVFASLANRYELVLPGNLFSGVLLTAVFCTLLSNRMMKAAGRSKTGTYVPMARWYLPASVTGGMGLLTLCGGLLMLLEIRGGKTVFYTAYEIAVWTFTIQALASFSRRMEGVMPRHGLKILLLCLLLVIALMGGAPYFAIYGLISALAGSHGVFRQRMERENSTNHHDSDKGND